MATKTIAWNTGSGNITLTYTGQGNGSISVSSSENDSFDERSQSVSIVTTAGSPEKALSVLIKQQGKRYAIGDVFNFGYTGSVQQVTLPKGRYKLQCWGAQGGTSYASSSGAGSKGGYSEGIITLTETTTFYIFVGGQGSRGSSSSLVNGGWNGGGASVGYSYYDSGGLYGESYPACGGGATDISTVTSSMNYSGGRTNRSSASLLARCIVAGGGAGGSSSYTYETVTSEQEYVVSSGYVPYSRKVSDTSYYYIEDFGYLEPSKTYNCSVIGQGTGSFKIEYYTNGVWTGSLRATANGSFGGTRTLSFTTLSDTSCTYILVVISQESSSYDFWYDLITTDYITEEYTSSEYSNQSQQGGGTSGKGNYPGTQSSAGSGGGFGYGANQSVTNYRYCSGGAGGGWYGGGRGYSDTSTVYVRYNGGGSGFVNTPANESYRPSGYNGLELYSGRTITGDSLFESPSGGNEIGHSGNGYARITVVADDYDAIPEGYSHLSYIQSSGSQYIDTGIIGKSNINMEMDMEFVVIPTDACIVGSRTSSVRYYPFHYYSYWTYGYGNYYRASSGALAGIRYVVKTTLQSGKQTMNVNGSNVVSGTLSSTYNTGYNIYVCACNNSGTAAYFSSIKIYSLKLYDGTTLVRDYTPVMRKSDKVCGLFDKVNGVFYPSKSGNFTGY